MLGGHLIAVDHTEATAFHREHVGVEDQRALIPALLDQTLQRFLPSPPHQGKRRQPLGPLLTHTFQVPEQIVSPGLLQAVEKGELGLGQQHLQVGPGGIPLPKMQRGVVPGELLQTIAMPIGLGAQMGDGGSCCCRQSAHGADRLRRHEQQQTVLR